MSYYYPSSAGSMIVPGSSYAGSHYSDGYIRPRRSFFGGHSQHYYAPPVMYGSSSPIAMPATSYHGGYGGYGMMPSYYGGSAPTVVVHRSSSRHRRHSSHRSHRYYDY